MAQTYDEFSRQGIVYKSADECLCGAAKETIDNYALTVAKLFDLAPGGDVFSVVRQLGGRIHYYDPYLGKGEEDTIFVHGKHDFDIILSDLASPRRDRFTAAHELGHYLLHSRIGDIPLKAGRKGTGRAEWEANWFAAGLLMPKDIFLKKISNNISLPMIADEFDVSLLAVEVRRKSLGDTQ